MIESSQQPIEEVTKQQWPRAEEQISAAELADANHEVAENVRTEDTEQTVQPNETLNRHAEAGRKGARRIHELIQQGRLYEREHGLKPGRQRLRQLIQEGKLYEREHGLSNGRRRAPEHRRPRMSSEQLLKTLFQILLRLAKPAYRSRMLGLIQALEAEVER